MPRLALALVVILAGCGGGSEIPGGTTALPGTAWTVERIVYPSGDVVRGSGETVAFGADGSLVMSSCNTCQGRYRFRRGVLEVAENLSCTRKACPPEAVELERVVSGNQEVSRDGPYLVLEARDAGGDAPQVLLLPSAISETEL